MDSRDNYNFLKPPGAIHPKITSPLKLLLSHLAFEGHGLRIGLELTFCVFIFALLKAIATTVTLGIPQEWQGLLAWFFSCMVVAIFDHIVFSLPLKIFRKTHQLELIGAYDEALFLLERISPYYGKYLVSCPHPLYHLRRSQIFTHQESYENAADELTLARATGLADIDYFFMKIYILRSRGEFELARVQLDAFQHLYGKHPIFLLEEAFLLLDERRDLKAAKKAFQKALDLPSVLHPWGETTKTFAKSYLEVTRLWTGEAEEGLEGLNQAINNLKAAAYYIDTLRPLVASLSLERAYYLATHKEPDWALDDLKTASAISKLPHHKPLSEKVREELAWRFKLTP